MKDQLFGGKFKNKMVGNTKRAKICHKVKKKIRKIDTTFKNCGNPEKNPKKRTKNNLECQLFCGGSDRILQLFTEMNVKRWLKKLIMVQNHEYPFNKTLRKKLKCWETRTKGDLISMGGCVCVSNVFLKSETNASMAIEGFRFVNCSACLMGFHSERIVSCLNQTIGIFICGE